VTSLTARANAASYTDLTVGMVPRFKKQERNMSYEIRELDTQEIDDVSGGAVSLSDAAIIIGGLMLIDTAVDNAIAATKAARANSK
jgi:hypothetical protein